MRLVADREAAEWLEKLAARPSDFEWDEGNRGKLAKHRVEPEEVESILGSPIVFAGRIIEPEHEEPRWLVLGARTHSTARVDLRSAWRTPVADQLSPDEKEREEAL